MATPITAKADEAISERGGRPRRYYRLTAEGCSAAMEQRRALAALLGELVHA